MADRPPPAGFVLPIRVLSLNVRPHLFAQNREQYRGAPVLAALYQPGLPMAKALKPPGTSLGNDSLVNEIREYMLRRARNVANQIEDRVHKVTEDDPTALETPALTIPPPTAS